MKLDTLLSSQNILNICLSIFGLHKHCIFKVYLVYKNSISANLPLRVYMYRSNNTLSWLVYLRNFVEWTASIGLNRLHGNWLCMTNTRYRCSRHIFCAPRLTEAYTVVCPWTWVWWVGGGFSHSDSFSW